MLLPAQAPRCSSSTPVCGGSLSQKQQTPPPGKHLGETFLLSTCGLASPMAHQMISEFIIEGGEGRFGEEEAGKA